MVRIIGFIVFGRMYRAERNGLPEPLSGIYPRLVAYYNNEGKCGTGAVVPWAERLWVITYVLLHTSFKGAEYVNPTS